MRNDLVDMKYETMTFVFENYKNDSELWQAVANFQQMLMKNDYECVVRQEDHIVVVVEYNHAHWKNFGNATPHWVDDDTWCDMVNYIENEQDDNDETETLFYGKDE